jgi:hypothetical protein
MWATSIMFGKQSNENTHPLGETSPNLVTLIMNHIESNIIVIIYGIMSLPKWLTHEVKFFVPRGQY